MAHRRHLPDATNCAPRVMVLTLLLVAVVAGHVACGKGQDTQPAGPASSAGSTVPAGAGPLGYCSVTITGAQNVSYTIAAEEDDFDTDYWRTEAETRELILDMFKFDEYQFFEEDEPYLVDQAMARDPRLNLFLMDCVGEQGVISFMPGRMSRYADVPFRPQTYEIAPAARLNAVTSGVFFANVRLGAGENSIAYAVTSPGELKIAVFNELQIAGTFNFTAAATGNRQIVVQGTFDYRKPKDEVFD